MNKYDILEERFWDKSTDTSMRVQDIDPAKLAAEYERLKYAGPWTDDAVLMRHALEYIQRVVT